MTEKVTDLEAKKQILFILHFINSKISLVFKQYYSKAKVKYILPPFCESENNSILQVNSSPLFDPSHPKDPICWSKPKTLPSSSPKLGPKEQWKCATCILKYNVNIRTGNLRFLFITTVNISTQIIEHMWACD